MKVPEWDVLIRRIESLRGREAAAPGIWGRMNLGQMLLHCRMPLEEGLGRRPATVPKGTFISRYLVLPMVLIFPWPKGRTPTPPEFRTVELGLPVGPFAEELARLLECVRAFSAPGFVPGRHPAFGAMKPAQWQKLQRRHLDHHLQQFGA